MRNREVMQLGIGKGKIMRSEIRNENSGIKTVPSQFLIPNSSFLIVNKSRGVTSQSIDRAVRRLFNVKRAGHAGTLDPFADGVLPIALGRATKFIDFLSDDKSYRAELEFGIATDTADCTGQTIEKLDDFEMPTTEQLRNVLGSFLGEIEQTPPKFSAIKFNGRKAYELARREIDFDMPSRRVTIERIELISSDARSVVIDVDCRKGTYIRSLAVDIGRAVGLPCMLRSLRRTKSGGFPIENASDIAELRAESFVNVEDALKHLPLIEITLERRKAFLNGLPTTLRDRSEQKIVRVNCGNEFLGVGSIVDGELKATKLFRLE